MLAGKCHCKSNYNGIIADADLACFTFMTFRVAGRAYANPTSPHDPASSHLHHCRKSKPLDAPEHMGQVTFGALSLPQSNIILYKQPPTVHAWTAIAL